MNRPLLRTIAASLFIACGLPAARAAAARLADCDAPGFATLLEAAAAPALPARAVWLDARRLRWPGAEATAGTRFALLFSAQGRIVATPGQAPRGAERSLGLRPDPRPLPAALAERVRWVGAGPVLALPAMASREIAALHRGQLVAVQLDAQGRVLQASGTQIALALDDLHGDADEPLTDFGATASAAGTAFRLWAPTAQAVSACLHDSATGAATALLPLHRARRGGSWFGQHGREFADRSYTYLVDVFVPGTGLVRNRVTDPYSTSLSADSHRSWIGRLAAAETMPPGWRETPRPDTVKAATDLVIYELHLRDFSMSDAGVPPEHRGKYLAFTHPDSAGMRHLRALREAGVTDVHLLPVFDFASVPERGCMTPDVSGTPDGESQQAQVAAVAARDCFNWGYDPLHYAAPEGSYAMDPDDGAARLREFRAMVLALHRAGLRVGMDMVYNHTSASGQKAQSVLDRIVPGYYQRLDAEGRVATSTCCDNTATEHRMMAKLMIDSAALWAREHRIDSMRFDLMGHQPRAAMERLQAAVDRAAGRHIHLIGEGWNFGEIADGARFVQAAQGRLAGSGIGSFSDRARDAVRGGGCCDDAAATLARQGWITGLFYDPNPHAKASREDLLRAADLVRVGLAGTLRDFRMATFDGSTKPLSAIDYAGQGAGFASQPDEVVNYVENHDNPTLYDIGVMKLPPATSPEDRARVQLLGLAVTAFSQGIAYVHAGVEGLRSKSLDRNSFDSGDWFNRIDWTFTDNSFGSGLPPKADNGALWPAMKPLLADPALKPQPAQMRFVRDAFLDLLRIRASTPLLRLRSAAEIAQRLSFPNSGAAQEPTVVVGRLDGRGPAPGAGRTGCSRPARGRTLALGRGHRHAPRAGTHGAGLRRGLIGRQPRLRRRRQAHQEARTLPLVADDADGAAHQPHQRARHRQADAGAVGRAARLAAALEGFEHARQLGFRDADAGVADEQVGPPVGAARDAQLDAAAGPVVLDRVAQQVQQHLAQARRVGEDAELVAGQQHQLHLRAFGGFAHQLQRLRRQPAQRHRLRLQAQAAGLDAGEVEQVADHVQQVLAGLAHELQAPALALAGRLDGVDLHQLREAQHRVQRRAQLMAHAREELGLRAARGLGHRGVVAGLLEQAALGHVLDVAVPDQPPVGHALGRGGGQQPALLAVAAAGAELAAPLAHRGAGLAQRGQHAPAVVDVDGGEDGIGIGQHLRRRQPEHRAAALVDVDEAPRAAAGRHFELVQQPGHVPGEALEGAAGNRLPRGLSGQRAPSRRPSGGRRCRSTGSAPRRWWPRR